MNSAIATHQCPHCALPAPEGLRAHLECALAATSKSVDEHAAQRAKEEQRELRWKLDQAALVARRQERERILEEIVVLRDEFRTAAQRSTTADGMAAGAQRAAALVELLQRLDDGNVTTPDDPHVVRLHRSVRCFFFQAPPHHGLTVYAPGVRAEPFVLAPGGRLEWFERGEGS